CGRAYCVFVLDGDQISKSKDNGESFLKGVQGYVAPNDKITYIRVILPPGPPGAPGQLQADYWFDPAANVKHWVWFYGKDVAAVAPPPDAMWYRAGDNLIPEEGNNVQIKHNFNVYSAKLRGFDEAIKGQ